MLSLIPQGPWWVVGLGAVLFIGVLSATAVVHGIALHLQIMDIPNRRSLHRAPVPGGGGAGFAVVLIALVSGLACTTAAAERMSLVALALWLVATAALGWVDDRRGLPATVRLVFQFLLVTSVLVTGGSFVDLDLAGFLITSGPVLAILTLLWFMWLFNLYNFMDGVDGIASVQAMVAGAFMAVWFAAAGDVPLAVIALAAATAGSGFLVWNRSPARIFMGDSGSTVLGFLFAWLAWNGVNRYGIPLAAFVLLLGVFIADATVTLFTRVLRRERLTEAHRSHFYQRAIASGCSHNQVTATVAVLAVLLAVPATMVWLDPSLQVKALVAGSVLLTGAAGIVVVFERRAAAGKR